MNTLTLELISQHAKNQSITQYFTVTGDKELITKFIKDIPYCVRDGKTIVWSNTTYRSTQPLKGMQLVNKEWIRVY